MTSNARCGAAVLPGSATRCILPAGHERGTVDTGLFRVDHTSGTSHWTDGTEHTDRDHVRAHHERLASQVNLDTITAGRLDYWHRLDHERWNVTH